MEEMELMVTQESDVEVKPEPSRWYEGHISLEDAKTFIKSNIATAARSFIAIGFYLKCVRDRELFVEEDYQDVWEFAKTEYGLSKSTASRYMSMNDRFSEGGNSPNIQDEYRAFGKSQLQEMLYLEDEQLEQVSPGDRVEDIRSLRKPKEVPYIELPGQLDFEMDFPDILPPDYSEAPLTSQKQTFEMSVEDMLSGKEQEGIAISQQDQEPEGVVMVSSLEALEEKRKEEWLIRCGVLKEMCDALCFMNSYGLEKDNYSMTAIQGISYGAYGFGFGDDGSGHSRYDADCKNSQYHVEEFNGKGKWVFESSEVDQYIWNFNGREWRIAHPEEQNQERSTFNSDPTPCLYREGYSCTLSEEKKMVPGDGHSCGLTCCWSCKFHGMCKMECNASAGRYGELPEYDAAWFVKEWALRSGDLTDVLRICRENPNNADRAKAIQEYISPYGARCRSCSEYSFSFNSFSGGMDFRVGKIEMHLKYGRLVQELSVLYPDFEEPERVSDQPGPVPESQETVIDGEFVELILPEQETIKAILEKEKKVLQDWIGTFEGERPEKWPPFIERQKIIVAALEAMMEDQERLEPEPEPAKQEQPELPILKNSDQRAAFVDAYETWPLWIEAKETGERYYRYDLPDRTSMVVKVYHAMLFDYKATGKKYEDRFCEGYGKHEYYFLQEGKFFRDCETNRSYLIEKLKELQKKGKGDK